MCSVPSAPSSTMSVKVPPMSTPTRKRSLIPRPAPWPAAAWADRATASWHHPSRAPADLLAAPGGGGGIDRPARDVDDHAVIVGRLGGRQKLVAHVLQHRCRIALQGIAPAAGTGQHMAEDVALLHRHGELAGQRAVLTLRIEVVLRRCPRVAAIEAERPMVAPVGADLQRALLLEEAVIAPERHAAAILAGPRLVGDELVGEQLDRLLGFGDLDRMRGWVLAIIWLNCRRARRTTAARPRRRR